MTQAYAMVGDAPAIISALVPFGIAGLAIAVVVVLAVFPKNGRTHILAMAIGVVCAIFAVDRYLQREKAQEAVLKEEQLRVLEAKSNKIAQTVRAMDTGLVSKMRFSQAPDVSWGIVQIKEVADQLCGNVAEIYSQTGQTQPIGCMARDGRH